MHRLPHNYPSFYESLPEILAGSSIGRKAALFRHTPLLRFCVYLKTSEVLPGKLPDHECSRSLAAKAVIGRYARTVGQNAIQLIHDNTWQWVKAALRGDVQRAAKLYIPEKLPPREVPGVWFQEPQSDTWRTQHRNVIFVSKQTQSVVNNL